MMETAVALSIYAQTPLTDAMNISPSMASSFFASKPFLDWKKSQEAKLKLDAAVISRLNEVIKGLGIVAKTVAGR